MPRALVGGIFLASADPVRMLGWYRALGLELDDAGMMVQGDTPATGIVFSVLPARPGFPAAAPPPGDLVEEPYGLQRATLNVRVEDLDATLVVLRARGDVVAGPKDYGYGRFAWTRDPDGNIVELWQAA